MSKIEPSIAKTALPYWGILCCALFVTASEVCLKIGVDESPMHVAVSVLGLHALASSWVWAGILCYIISFVFWIKVLQVLPLGVAFNLANIEHVFVALASYLFLGETVSPLRAIGIGVVLLGIWVIAEPYCRAEERL